MSETGEDQRFCRQCLLKDFDETAYKETLESYIERMGKDLRTEETEYDRRLSICLSCEKLNQGTCLACGCYVELRAAAKTGHCPKKKW